MTYSPYKEKTVIKWYGTKILGKSDISNVQYVVFCFSHSEKTVLIVYYAVANPARGLQNRKKKRKRESLAAAPQ